MFWTVAGLHTPTNSQVLHHVTTDCELTLILTHHIHPLMAPAVIITLILKALSDWLSDWSDGEWEGGWCKVTCIEDMLFPKTKFLHAFHSKSSCQIHRWCYMRSAPLQSGFQSRACFSRRGRFFFSPIYCLVLGEGEFKLTPELRSQWRQDIKRNHPPFSFMSTF